MRRCAASFAATRGEDYTAFLTRLAEASGIATPTRAELARFAKSRKRKKKTSNAEWTHPYDPDARVTKMKDGRTHLAHKAEHAADLDTGAVVGVTVQAADTGDTTSMVETLIVAAEQLEAVQPDGAGREEVVGDKGYHSDRTLTDLKAPGLRSYISEPDRGRRCWRGRSKARDFLKRLLVQFAGCNNPGGLRVDATVVRNRERPRRVYCGCRAAPTDEAERHRLEPTGPGTSSLIDWPFE